MNNFICKKCGTRHEYLLRETKVGTGIATGLYCGFCGSWQKWVNKQELKNLVAEAIAYETTVPEKLKISEEEKTIDERIAELKKTIAALQDLKERFKAVREKREQEKIKNQDFVPNLDDLSDVEDTPPWGE